jgi:hypothetical protein
VLLELPGPKPPELPGTFPLEPAMFVLELGAEPALVGSAPDEVAGNSPEETAGIPPEDSSSPGLLPVSPANELEESSPSGTETPSEDSEQLQNTPAAIIDAAKTPEKRMRIAHLLRVHNHYPLLK